jgi:hypothetical protein
VPIFSRATDQKVGGSIPSECTTKVLVRAVLGYQYQDGRGGWYVKVSLGRDPLTGRREQITRRGFRAATEAGKARRELHALVDRGAIKARPGATTVNELMDLYLDGLDADGRLSAKTRFDYRHSTDDSIRGRLGDKRVRDITAETVLACNAP